MRWKPFNAITRITNPITIEHTMMRHFLLPGYFGYLLRIDIMIYHNLSMNLEQSFEIIPTWTDWHS